MPLLPHAKVLLWLLFNMSAIKFTVDVLPFVPVIHIYFDFLIDWSISISVVILHNELINSAKRLQSDLDPVVRDAADWAIAKLKGPSNV